MFAIYKKLLAVNQSQGTSSANAPPLSPMGDHTRSGEGGEDSGGEDDDDDSRSRSRFRSEANSQPYHDNQWGQGDNSSAQGSEDGETGDESQPLLQQQRLEKQLKEEKRRKIKELWQSMVKDSLLRNRHSLGRGREHDDPASDLDGDDKGQGSLRRGSGYELRQNRVRLGDAGPGPNFAGPGGGDHGSFSDDRKGEADNEEVAGALPLTDRLFQKLFNTQGNPVILFGNSFSIKSTFNTKTQEFELEFNINKSIDYRYITIPLDDLQEYKSIISQKLFSPEKEAEDEEQQQRLDILIKQNFNDNLQAPLLKDDDDNSIAELILQSIYNADRSQYEARLAQLELS